MFEEWNGITIRVLGRCSAINGKPFRHQRSWVNVTKLAQTSTWAHLTNTGKVLAWPGIVLTWLTLPNYAVEGIACHSMQLHLPETRMVIPFKSSSKFDLQVTHIHALVHNTK